jgi:hypothetical protein
MLKTMTSYFGRLESFSLLEPLKNARGLHVNDCISLILTESCLDDRDQISEDEKSPMEHELYPAPHNAPRSPGMDNACWEIKWEHRDDCVSALMVKKFRFYLINQGELILKLSDIETSTASHRYLGSPASVFGPPRIGFSIISSACPRL